MTIQQKVSNLLKLRSLIDKAKKQLEPLQQKRDELQSDIISDMTKQGFNSIKTDKATVAKMISKRLVIQDEGLLVGDLKKRGLTDYVRERVDSQLWQSFSRQAIKENLILKGTEIVESEYISVRQNKKGGGENNE